MGGSRQRRSPSSSSRKRRRRRTIGNEIPLSEEKKRIELSLETGGRVIKGDPRPPRVRNRQMAPVIKKIQKSVAIITKPAMTVPQFKTKAFRSSIDNASALREKYRTQYDSPHIKRVHTSQYRERDVYRPLGQYNISY